ncbi:hypothetical protein HDK90DRAFT_479969 [Phyllosticta capitalensis]|uniref:Secreted protein n=1 Tax=Phyllosticta capitalensis TaxID=121624 RepID=A0ABR1YWV2_9PEZI
MHLRMLDARLHQVQLFVLAAPTSALLHLLPAQAHRLSCPLLRLQSVVPIRPSHGEPRCRQGTRHVAPFSQSPRQREMSASSPPVPSD